MIPHMTKLYWPLVLLLFCAGKAVSQNSYFPVVPHPEWFKTIPLVDENTPDWAVMMYGSDPNYYEVLEAYDTYYRTHDWKKTEHIQNFKHWLKWASPYRNDEGFLRKPTPEQEDRLAEVQLEKRSLAGERALPWSCIGPFETYIAGTMTKDSHQGNVYALDQSDSNPDILYAGTESGAIYKSINHGLTWSPTSFNETFVGGYGGLEIHPTNPNVVMVSTNNRIYRTTDGGATWSEVTLLGALGYEIKYRPSNPDSVFCAAANGLYLSTNAGATWGSAIYADACYDLDWHTSDADTVYLLKNNAGLKRPELFMSPNAGANWYLKSNGYYTPADPVNASVNGGKIGLSADDPDRVYVALIGASKAGDNGWIGVLRSNNRGETWTVPAGQYGGPYQPANTMPWNVAAYSDGYHQGFYNFDFEVSQLNADLMWIGTIRLSESSDGGTSFIAIGAAESIRLDHVHADIQDIEVNGTEVWVANDGGIEYSSDNLQTFESRKYGIAGSDYWGFGAGWNEDILVGGRYHTGNSGYFQTYNVGETMKLGGVEESTGYVHPMERKAFFNQSWSGGTAVRSIPDAIGQNYTTYGYLPLIPNESYAESNSSGLYFDPRYANHFYMGEGSNIWKSRDAGLSFQSLKNFGSGGRTLEIEISRKNPNYIYVVFKPNGINARQIWRSTDGGVNWSQLPNVPASNRNKLEITLNPSDENELWVASNDASNGQKVYLLISNGTAWQNMSTSALDGEHPIDIYFQGGTTSTVYLATNNNVFYFDGSTWVNMSSGLPTRPRSFKFQPFYRDGKLRMATYGQGIWETSLAVSSLPIAQPITLTDSIYCSRDTIQFDSYSIASGSATYSWSITPAPQYVSSLTVRNPKVVFGMNGNYTVALTVTEGPNSDTKTIADMVKVNSFCEPDTIPGKVLHTAANGDYFISQSANLTNLTNFTVTGWWKPNGTQQSFAALFSSGDWCAHCDDTEGLIFDYYGSKLWYKWPGNASNWGSNSGITVPLDEWSYVALVITPDSAIMYLNGQKYKHVKTLNPGQIPSIHFGKGHYDHYFKGDIDEVTMWRRSLTEAEVRSLRHITKEDIIAADPDLIGYWQFNELIGGTKVMDKSGKYHGNIAGGATLTTSTAPVGGGVSQTIQLTSGTYTYNFTNAGAKIWMSDCDSPSGTLVASRLNIAPDAQPNSNDFPENYWIFNLYGGGGSFPPLDSLELTPTDAGFAAGIGNASTAVLHLRSENGEGATWDTKAKGIKKTGNTLRFNRNSTVLGSNQITLSNGAPYFDAVDPGRVCEADTIPGKSLTLPGGSGNYAVVPTLNLNTNTFTATAWIKPNGLQNDNAGVIFSRGGSTTSGIHMKTNNEVRYHWDGGQWGWSSGAIAPANEWTHVALVVEPTRATIYLNGVPYVNTATHNPEAFDSPIRIGNDPNSSSRTYKGDIDEVCIWNRALSQSEVRELMHLTKEDILSTDTNLKVYLQFDEDSGKAYDKTGNLNHATMNSTSLTRSTSSAPVGGGISNRTTVSSGGVYTFGNTGVKMGFKPSGPTFPNGELLVSRINVPPHNTPIGTNIVSDSLYFVVRNFGSNQNFTALDSIVFGNLPTVYEIHESSPSMFTLFKRSSNAFGNSWGSSLDLADLVEGTPTGVGKITFNSGSNITSFSQFSIGDGREVLVRPKVFLEGPYTGGTMTDNLRSSNLLPTTEPYSGLSFNHKNGGGGESCPPSAFSTTGNDAITDWLFVELRDPVSPSNVLYTRSALLQRDGDVVDMDGTSPVDFRLVPPGNYYLVIRHRNHLGIMTAGTLALSATPTTVDFTSISTGTWGTNAQRNINGVMAMWTGDADYNGQVQNTDIEYVWKPTVGLSGYLPADFNMNGQVQNTDLELFWKLNVGLGTQLP